MGKKEYKNIKKYNILLDLDECIIKSQFIENKYEMNSKYFTKGPHNYYIFQTQPDKKTGNHFIVYTRPYLKEFLEFLFNNFNVGIWTTGTTEYAKNLVKKLLDYFDMKDKYNDLICFITRKPSNNIKTYMDGAVYKKKAYDIINKITFDISFGYTSVKDLTLLFNNPIYKNKNIHSHNTILIDDNIGHNGINNGNNIISIYEYNYLITCDNLLKKLKKYLINLLLLKDKINISQNKLKQFITTKPNIFNEYVHNKGLNYVTRIDSYCKTINKVKPRSKISSKVKPSSKIISKVKPRSKISSKVKPSSKIISKVKPRSKIPSKVKPSSKISSKVKPRSKISSKILTKTKK